MATRPEDWEKVKALFDASLHLDRAARSAFLRGNCSDAEVRAEVERLLIEYDQAGEFLSQPALAHFHQTETFEPPPSLAQGQLLAGRFRVVRFIAAGGMGEVYEAEDEELHERVAIKTIRPEILAQPNALVRFKREVHLARKVTHPNVCRIFDLFRHRSEEGSLQDETVFISMELLNGKSLDACMEEAGRMNAAATLSLVRSMASALAAAHAAGIVHRDFKPGNVVLVRSGEGKTRPVVTDFGLALQNLRSNESATATSTQGVVGTPAYMSPEQLEGRPATPASDVYALGLVIYEMITGVRPFQGDTSVSAALKRLTENPTPPRKFRPELQPIWDSTILRCLERDPSKRFEKVEEVATSLAAENTIPPSGINLKILIRQSMRPAIVLPLLIGVLTLASFAAWWLQRAYNIRWAREQALPQIAQLIKNEKVNEAYALAMRADRYIPNDPELHNLWPDISWIDSIDTTPSGSSVFRREYNDPNGKWEFLGHSPITKRRFPDVNSSWRFELKGFATVERASFPDFLSSPALITMDGEHSIPSGMVRVDLLTRDGRPNKVGLEGLPGLENTPRISLETYWIGRFEVTNAEFKRFVDDGGYEKQEYWTHEFRRDGRLLSWADAMKLFKDRTGRPGPATWIQGKFPRGQDNYPVTGVSWFEAAAYAAFTGQALPTIYHWREAAQPANGPNMIPASNFAGQGPAVVGAYQGMSSFGAYDMAGNVKEWVFNEDGLGKRYILGGAWNEPSYTFYDPDARSPFQRLANFGFRVAKYPSVNEFAKASDPVTAQVRNYALEKPISDQLFQVYKTLYAYDKTPLNATVEQVKQTDDWKEEKITFAAAYGNEQVSAYLFLPLRVKPPYQAVLHFPPAGALRTQSSADLDGYFDNIEFMITSGRAVMFPIYKGTFERGGGTDTNPWPRTTVSYRDRIIMWSKDLGRSIDYLETRSDIDHNKLAYEGYSMGAALGSLFPGIEDRFRAVVLICGGFWLQKRLPEVDQLNFAPRVKAPVLMLGGRFDYIFPMGTSQEPMFKLLGTSREQKRWVTYDTGHDIPQNELIKQTIGWLDRYLGPIKH